MPGGEKNGQSGGRDFFFSPNFIFYELECTGGKEFFFFLKDAKKMLYLQVLDPVGRWTGNAFSFEDGLSLILPHNSS